MGRNVKASLIIPGVERLIALALAIAILLPWLKSNRLLLGSANLSTGFDVCVALLFLASWKVAFNGVEVWAILERSFKNTLAYVTVGSSIASAVLVAAAFAMGVRNATSFLAIAAKAECCFALLVSTRILITFLASTVPSLDRSRVVILGTGPMARKAWRILRTNYHSSVKVIGFLDDREPKNTYPEIEQMFVGLIRDFEHIMLREVIDTVVIAMPAKSCYESVQSAITVAEEAGVDLVYFDGAFNIRTDNASIRQNALTSTLSGNWKHECRLMTKRATDVFASAIGLLVLLPVLLMIAAIVKLTSPGPALFVQERFGHRRRRFNLLKFRTMVTGAESMIRELEEHNEADGPIFKMKNDPRVTPIGRFLRKTSLDEIPQLWNVLVGEMSLVGPRPMSVRDVSLFSSSYLMRRFRVTPGMTGLWQVSGRSNVTFDHWMALDFRYIETWSLMLDLKILLKTIPAVLKGSGAM